MGIRKLVSSFVGMDEKNLIGLTLTIFQTNCLIAVKYDYIHYNNVILMGKIAF
ncbi:hypothetical protein MM0345_15000 [Helicobacter pylori]